MGKLRKIFLNAINRHRMRAKPNIKLFMLLLTILMLGSLAHAKRITLRGPKDLFIWLPLGSSPQASAVSSICLGFEAGIIIALILRLKGSTLKESLKSLILASLFSSLPGLGYLITLCLGAYYEGKTSSQLLFDFLENYYPSALVLGMLAGFLRAFYAFRKGKGLRSSISLGIFYWFFVFSILLFTSYMWDFMDLLKRWGGFEYALLAMPVGIFHIVHCLRRTLNMRQALIEGISLWALVGIGIWGALYWEKQPVVWDNFSAWRTMLVFLCTLLVILFVSQLYLNPKLFTKEKE